MSYASENMKVLYSMKEWQYYHWRQWWGRSIKESYGKQQWLCLKSIRSHIKYIKYRNYKSYEKTENIDTVHQDTLVNTEDNTTNQQNPKIQLPTDSDEDNNNNQLTFDDTL